MANYDSETEAKSYQIKMCKYINLKKYPRPKYYFIKLVTYCVDEFFSSNAKCNKILLFYIMAKYDSEMEMKSYQTQPCKIRQF